MSHLSIAQTYMLASRAQAKLQREAQRPELNLRVLLSHAHLLDNVIGYLSDPSARSHYSNTNNKNSDCFFEESSAVMCDEEDDIDNEEDFEIEIEDAELSGDYRQNELGTSSSSDDDDDEDLEYDDIQIIRTNSHSNNDIRYVNYFKPTVSNASAADDSERSYTTSNNVMFSVSEISDSEDSEDSGDEEEYTMHDPYRYEYYEGSFIDCREEDHTVTKKKSRESINSSEDGSDNNSDFSLDELDDEDDYVLRSAEYSSHSGSYYFEDIKSSKKAVEEEEIDITDMSHCHIPRRSAVF